MSGCLCQRHGKSGVPHDRTFRCLVCGAPVDPFLPFVCPVYRPDATGACHLCTGPVEAHTQVARALGTPLPAGMVETRCQLCDDLIGLGAPQPPTVCAACRAAPGDG